MNQDELADAFGRRLVERVHHDLLADELRGMRGEYGEWAQLLDAAKFSPEQRRLMWRHSVKLVEAAVYRVVHFIDEEVENKRLTLEVRDPDSPDDSGPWRWRLDNPPGFASEMFERFGVDFEKRYAESEPDATPFPFPGG